MVRFIILCARAQEEGIADVTEMMKQERPFPERRLRGVLDDLAGACSKFGTLMQGKSGGGASAGRTKLDKERVKLCQREVVRGKHKLLQEPCLQSEYTESLRVQTLRSTKNPFRPLILHKDEIELQICLNRFRNKSE